jgi:hypothetical protein
MSEPAINRTTTPAPSLVDVLKLRAWARAYLWWAGAIDSIPAAIDPLQEFAEHSGLAAEIVQQILADAFAPFRGASDE